MRTKQVIEAVCAFLCFFFGKCKLNKFYTLPLDRRLRILLVKDGKQ